MSKWESQFFSIVLLGRQNPKILNHDFLVKNKILPSKHEPFKSLFKTERETYFSEFISTPVVASIKYENISIVIQEDRYQIMDSNFHNPKKSPIILLTKNYFGKVLRYTPFRLGGVNFNGFIKFRNRKDETLFDKSLGIEIKYMRKLANEKDVRTGCTFNFPYDIGIIEIQVSKPKNQDKVAKVNFNYEYPYKDIKSFTEHLDEAPMLYERFIDILGKLHVESD